ncbi:transcription termination/antitermination protein NusG [Phenylobacterium sp.]|uniref:transcription termination/antitermination protein NusG n=1 Tax=Phenylobacterium sp. TaxID=1871053 RepID=UPI00345CA705
MLRALTEAGLTSYFPLHVTEAKHARRKATRSRPLIAGYVFAELPTDEAIHEALSIRGVFELVSQNGKPRRIPSIAIGSLILADAFHLFDETWVPPRPKGKRYSHAWKRGDRVRIEDGGAFDGFKAEVLRANGRDRMAVLLMIFGRLTEVIVEHRDLRKAA